MLTASLDDYLYAIYKLSNKENGTRVTDISNFLNVKKSSTNSALNTLKTQELVNYEKYKTITLTEIRKSKSKACR